MKSKDISKEEVVLTLGYDPEDYFTWPNETVENLKASFCYHGRQYADAVKRTVPPTEREVLIVLNRLEKTLSCIRTNIEKDYSFEKFKQIVTSTVDWTSSPGFPWCSQYPTNRELFGFDGFQVDPISTRKVFEAVHLRLRELEKGPKADPLKVFIKAEPIKKTKVEKGAYRLISGVGITDTLVDRLLMGNLCDRVIDTYDKQPILIGWNPAGGGWNWLRKKLNSPLCADKSAWDWTVQPWMIEIVRRFVQRISFGVDATWNTRFNNRLDALYGENVIMKTDCDLQLRTIAAGVQKSGSLTTIFFNSLWQLAIHELATLRMGVEMPVPYCLGDDTVQDFPYGPDVMTEYVAALESTGARVKETTWHPTEFEFAGVKITDVPRPLYGSKHGFRMIYMSPELAPETLYMYQLLYAYEPNLLSLIQAVLVRIGHLDKVRSTEFLCDHWTPLE